MPPRLSGDDASNFFAKITLGILGLLSRWEPWCIFQRVGGMWLEELSDFSHDPVSLATLKRSLRKEVGVLPEKQMIAVCGLDCTSCDIREAPHDKALAQSIADWFKDERDTIVKVEDIRCDGCRGERSKH